MALETMLSIRAIRRLTLTEVGRVRGEVVLRLMALHRMGRMAGLREYQPLAGLSDMKRIVLASRCRWWEQVLRLKRFATRYKDVLVSTKSQIRRPDQCLAICYLAATPNSCSR